MYSKQPLLGRFRLLRHGPDWWFLRGGPPLKLSIHNLMVLMVEPPPMYHMSHWYWANFLTWTRTWEPGPKYSMSHRYWVNFWVHKRVRVPEYGSRLPITGPILGTYLGPGSRVRVQVPKYGSRFPSTGPIDKKLAQYPWDIRYFHNHPILIYS